MPRPERASVTLRRSCRGVRGSLRGFTLLEVLLAVAVFAVVSALAFTGLQNVMTIDEATRDTGRELAELQIAFALFERDLGQVVAVAPRDSFGDRLDEFVVRDERDGLEISWVRAGGGGNERLQRVGWRIADGSIERFRYPVVDGSNDDTRRFREVLARVEEDAPDAAGEPRIRFVDSGGELLDRWDRDGFPAQIRIDWPTRRWGMVSRRFAVPERLSASFDGADAGIPDDPAGEADADAGDGPVATPVTNPRALRGLQSIGPRTP